MATRTNDGKVYCAAVMDAYSRLIVGWSIAGHTRTELVTDALGMAMIRRRPDKRMASGRTIRIPTTARKADSTGRRNTSPDHGGV